MSQQEFLDFAPHNAETTIYEPQELVEATRAYPEWEQNNEFSNRHLFGEKVHPRPDNRKAGMWILLPLLALLFLVGSGLFGLTMAPSPSTWNDDGFAPRHMRHHPPCQTIFITGPQQQFGPSSAGGPRDPSQIIIVSKNICNRP